MRYFYVSYTCFASNQTSNPTRCFNWISFQSEGFLNQKELYCDIINAHPKSIIDKDTICILSIFEFNNEEDFKNFRE